MWVLVCGGYSASPSAVCGYWCVVVIQLVPQLCVGIGVWWLLASPSAVCGYWCVVVIQLVPQQCVGIGVWWLFS